MPEARCGRSEPIRITPPTWPRRIRWSSDGRRRRAVDPHDEPGADERASGGEVTAGAAAAPATSPAADDDRGEGDPSRHAGILAAAADPAPDEARRTRSRRRREHRLLSRHPEVSRAPARPDRRRAAHPLGLRARPVRRPRSAIALVPRRQPRRLGGADGRRVPRGPVGVLPARARVGDRLCVRPAPAGSRSAAGRSRALRASRPPPRPEPRTAAASRRPPRRRS